MIQLSLSHSNGDHYPSEIGKNTVPFGGRYSRDSGTQVRVGLYLKSTPSTYTGTNASLFIPNEQIKNKQPKVKSKYLFVFGVKASEISFTVRVKPVSGILLNNGSPYCVTINGDVDICILEH